jgi:hypothetical protein
MNNWRLVIGKLNEIVEGTKVALGMVKRLAFMPELAFCWLI